MGEVAHRVVVVRFRGTEYEGHTVKLRAGSVEAIGRYLSAKTDAAAMAVLEEHLMSWDLTQNGEPVPMTLAALLALDLGLANSIGVGWRDGSGRIVRDNPTAPPALAMNGSGGFDLTAPSS